MKHAARVGYNAIKIVLMGEVNEMEDLEDLVVDGSTILKWILG